MLRRKSCQADTENMNISSIYDKDCDREIIKEHESANRLQVFEDRPFHDDNWEVTDFYQDKMEEINSFVSVNTIKGLGYGGFRVTREYNKSKIVQDIVVYSEDRRIDFKTFADWHENHVLLKASFPTDIHSTKATYEIQFGNVERNTHKNTSWDAAKFEVCAQKWADISEEGYGVSILNNCKYGYSAEGSEIKLTLIKCGTFPNTEADQGEHSFTYTLLPHKDGYRQGKTIEEAYLLNRPLETAYARGKGTLAESFSFAACDSPNIVIETVKRAEDGRGFIIRLYDAWDKKSKPVIKFGLPIKKISLCDMMENDLAELGEGDELCLKVNNFEIVTLRIEL